MQMMWIKPEECHCDFEYLNLWCIDFNCICWHTQLAFGGKIRPDADWSLNLPKCCPWQVVNSRLTCSGLCCDSISYFVWVPQAPTNTTYFTKRWPQNLDNCLSCDAFWTLEFSKGILSALYSNHAIGNGENQDFRLQWFSSINTLVKLISCLCLGQKYELLDKDNSDWLE